MVYLRKDNDVQRALADFDLALDCDPADASALLNRGYVRLTLGQRDPALADLRRAVDSSRARPSGAVDPGRPEAFRCFPEHEDVTPAHVFEYAVLRDFP